MPTGPRILKSLLVPVLALALIAIPPGGGFESAYAQTDQGIDTLVSPEVDPNANVAVEPISPPLKARLATAKPTDRIPIIVRLSETLDLAEVATSNQARLDPEDNPPPVGAAPRPTAPAEVERQQQSADVIDALIEHSERTRLNIEQILEWRQAQGKIGAVTPLWIINGLATTATPSVIAELARRPDVALIDLNAPIAMTQQHNPPEPNISTIGAPDYWAQGFDGQGVVVGVIDSGADIFVGELADTWRGGSNSWIDYVDATSTPVDPPSSFGVPHGTLTTGIVVGDDRGGSAIGVAPGSEWIGARVFNQQGQASIADIHAAFQWMLDPDGDAQTSDAPAVVNSSWVLTGVACDLEFEADVQALVAAGILPVFAAGNAGVTSGGASPGNYVDALAVGAVDSTDTLWDDQPFGASNLGPTDCGTPGTNRTFPDLVAPGVGITTVEGANYYSSRTGTSVAAPHVTGAAALLLSEFPGLTTAQLRAALEASAVDLGPAGPDNSYGAGRLDVMAARADLLAATIGDLVWSDTNANGVFDQGEPGIGTALVKLFGPGPDLVLGSSDDVAIDSTTTDVLGQYIFDGLEPSSYRVEVDQTSLPIGYTLTTASNPTDVTVAAGEVRSDIDFGFLPPPPGSISGLVWDDLDLNGSPEPTEPAAVGVGVKLIAPGADQVLGSADDEIIGSDFSDAAGQYTFTNISPGTYLVAVDVTTLPSGSTSTTGGHTRTISVGAGQTVAGVDFGYSIPALDTVYLSLRRGGTVNGGGLRYSDEDILAWDGTSFSVFFDGSDVGLHDLDVDAFQVLGSSSVALSLTVATTLPGVGEVDDSDVVLFTGTMGPDTAGTFELYFDGSDVGLTTSGEDIDGLDILDDGTILLSTRHTVRVPGLNRQEDEDVLAFAPSSLGANTAGLWSLWFDGSEVGLDTNGEDLDAIDSGGEDLLISTLGDFSVDGVTGADHDIATCNDWDIGPATSCNWTQYLLGAPIGLGGADIDGISVRGELPGAGGGTPDVETVVLSLDTDGVVNGGALAYDELDVLLWDGTSFSMVFDASDVGITSGDLDAVHVVDDSTLLLSFDSNQNLDGLEIDHADIVTFTGQLGEDTAGSFELTFDGTDVGLLNWGGNVDGVHLRSDGSLIVTIQGNRYVPGLGVVQDRDLLAFTPTSLGADTAGTWAMFLDGSASGLDSYAEDINAVRLDDGKVHLSTISGGDVSPFGPFLKRDVMTCSDLTGPTAPCTWTKVLDGSALGLNGYGIDAISAPS